MTPGLQEYAQAGLQHGHCSCRSRCRPTIGCGDEHCADCSFTNFVESSVMPGVYCPLTITMQAHATGPSDHASGRGWEIARFDITTLPMATFTAAAY